MRKPITRISFGLFYGSFWMKLKGIPILLKRAVYTLRHGYPPAGYLGNLRVASACDA